MIKLLNVDNDRGFTIIELIIVMVITLFVLAAATQVMINMTSQFKQQTRIAQSSIEGGFGLEMLRKDLSVAGFGLPTGIYNVAASTLAYDKSDWGVLNATYKELAAAEIPGSQFNSGQGPPKMVMVDSPTGSFNGSDYLVIKSAAVGVDEVAGKFKILLKDNISSSWTLGDTEGAADPWRNPTMPNASMVVVLTTRDKENLGLVLDPQFDEFVTVKNFYTTASNTYNYRPMEDADLSVVYAISYRNSDGTVSTQLRAPFNRVDYYLTKDDVPQRCAPGININTGTGSLYKAEMDHKSGRLDIKFKILDCVAAMKVVLALDVDGDGKAETFVDRDNVLNPATIRKRLQRVDVYLLTHEGGFDANYVYLDDNNDGIIEVGDVVHNYYIPFDAKNLIGSHLVQGEEFWKHFRWRVLKVSERPAGRGTF